MAKTYKAATRIKHGKEGGESVVFEVGETVTGLPKDAMKALWDAGALQADDGTTSDAMQPDLTAEVRESVTPDDKEGMTVEEVAGHAPDGGKDTQKGTTDASEKPVGGTESKPVTGTPVKATPAKATTTSATKTGPAAPESK